MILFVYCLSFFFRICGALPRLGRVEEYFFFFVVVVRACFCMIIIILGVGIYICILVFLNE